MRTLLEMGFGIHGHRVNYKVGPGRGAGGPLKFAEGRGGGDKIHFCCSFSRNPGWGKKTKGGGGRGQPPTPHTPCRHVTVYFLAHFCPVAFFRQMIGLKITLKKTHF
jgi:hypothetical protein